MRDDQDLQKSRCDWCEKEFDPARYWQRFCSDECREKWHVECRSAGAKALREQRQKRADDA